MPPVRSQVSSANLLQSIQEFIAAAGIIAFLWYTIVVVHVGRWPLLGAGIVLFTAIFVLGRRLRTANRSAKEPIAVALVCWLGFAMPVAVLSGPRLPGFISAAIGVATVWVIWASLRYEIQLVQSDGALRNVLWGLGWGAALAAGFSILAVLIVALNARSAARFGDEVAFILG